MTFGRGSTLATGVAVGAAVGAAGVLGAVAARRALVLITVSGGSMSPTYTDGEKLLVRRGRLRPPQVGDVVVFRHPHLSRAAAPARTAAAETASPGPGMPAAHTAVPRPDVDWMVKRVVAVGGDRVPEEFRHAVGAMDADTTVPAGNLLVLGDNPKSLDSRQFGYVPAGDVLGVSVRRRPRASA